MPAADTVDAKYYQVVAPRSWSERLLVAARDRIHADFMHCCRPAPTDAILDVGVSDVLNAGANVLERKYPHQHRITACGLGEAHEFREAFPRLAYVRLDADQPLPFADRSFDIATSNAVLEHVGSPERQALFVREMLRVAKKVFISVPHRYFPIEHHTAIPLLHFWSRPFALACRHLGKSEWAQQENLILMSKADLAALAPSANNAHVGYTGLPLGPFSSNLFLFVDQTSERV